MERRKGRPWPRGGTGRRAYSKGNSTSAKLPGTAAFITAAIASRCKPFTGNDLGRADSHLRVPTEEIDLAALQVRYLTICRDGGPYLRCQGRKQNVENA